MVLESGREPWAVVLCCAAPTRMVARRSSACSGAGCACRRHGVLGAGRALRNGERQCVARTCGAVGAVGLLVVVVPRSVGVGSARVGSAALAHGACRRLCATGVLAALHVG